MRTKVLTALTLASVFGSAAALAAQPANPLLGQLAPNISIEEYIARVVQPYDGVAANSGIITTQDLAAIDLKRRANRRAQLIGEVLRNDLNGDFRVTEAEFGKDKPGWPAGRGEFATYDRNGDGKIEMSEIAKVAAEQYQPDPRTVPYETLMAFPIGKDGKIMRDEIKSFAEQTFREADKDGDGRLSNEESRAARVIRN